LAARLTALWVRFSVRVRARVIAGAAADGTVDGETGRTVDGTAVGVIGSAVNDPAGSIANDAANTQADDTAGGG
jgi:hypothetical protein